MPTVTASQVRPSTTLLNSPLTRDAIITLQWLVEDGHERVERQRCIVGLAAGYALASEVDPDKRIYSFRLGKGTTLSLPLTAEVRIDLAARTLAPAHPAMVAHSNPVQIQFPSVLVPEREAITTVYTELNQELRRTRTLYESFLVVVTGGLATLYSKRDAIVGASHREWMGGALIALVGIVIYMLWQVARRYSRNSEWTKNLECALGVRAGDPQENLMPEHQSWWEDDAWRHTLWAMLLTVYTAVLGISAGYALLAKQPDKVNIAPPVQAQKAPPELCPSICCCGAVTQAPIQAAGKPTPPASSSPHAQAGKAPPNKN